VSIHVEVPGPVEEQILRICGGRTGGMRIDEPSISQCFEGFFRAEIPSANPTRFTDEISP
jgi:hypothetical protein